MHRAEADPFFSDFEASKAIFNVWNDIRGIDHEIEHPGACLTLLTERLMWLYTKPGDLVIDCFAGSGSTLDVARRRGRRAWLSDRKPIVAREHEIRRYDLVTDGFPNAPLNDAQLLYLDPPYGPQTFGQYSSDPTDLANMSPERYIESMVKIINSFAGAMRPGSFIALLIRASAQRPTEDGGWERDYRDWLMEIAKHIDLPIEMRFQVPNALGRVDCTRIEWAVNTKNVLVKSRELIVWRV